MIGGDDKSTTGRGGEVKGREEIKKRSTNYDDRLWRLVIVCCFFLCFFVCIN